MNYFSPILSFAFLILGLSPAFSQEAIELISQSSCECITELQASGEVTSAGQAVESCIQQAIFANLTPIMEAYDFDLSNEEEATSIGEEIGMQVGMKLVTDCPAFMAMMMDNQEGSDNIDVSGLEDYGVVEEEPETTYESLEAVFEEEDVTKGGFSYLIFKDEYGEESRFLWLSPFAGDELIGKELEGKAVTIEWESVYIRNGKDEDYQKTKVIRRLYD